MKVSAYFMEVSENGVVFTGQIGEIENTLEAMQHYIVGIVRVTRLDENIIAIHSGEENDPALPMNRALVVGGVIRDILKGNILCVREKEREWVSIQEQDIPRIHELLKPMFDLNGCILVNTCS